MITPGLTELTLTPLLAISNATHLVNWSMAALLFKNQIKIYVLIYLLISRKGLEMSKNKLEIKESRKRFRDFENLFFYLN